MRPDPEGDPPRAAHPAAGRGAAPQDEARAAFAGDAFQVGADAQLAQVALGIDQPAVGDNRADRAARLSPVVGGVTVGITPGHSCRTLTLGPRGLAA